MMVEIDVLKQITAEHKELREALEYYATTNWREITYLDQGSLARRVLKIEKPVKVKT